MKYAAFDTIDEARAWRHEHGGHIFLANDGEAIWFGPAFTATPILLHPAVRGRMGILNPT